MDITGELDLSNALHVGTPIPRGQFLALPLPRSLRDQCHLLNA